MALLLYRYIKRKRNEKKEKELTPTGEVGSQLTPDISTPRKPNPEELEALSGDGANNVQGAELSPTENEEEQRRRKEEARRMTIYRWKMIIGLALPNFLSAVDLTIVAPAIPTISSHFNHLSGSFNWIVAAYTLTFTTFVPASGQIADIYGRHFALHFQIFWILIGSILCASSVTWGMLLFGRALQGLGAAGILNLTRIIFSDGMSLADNSKNNTIFSLINGISFSVGPVIGGYLSDSSWRYCFVVPIPIAVLSHLLVFFLMRNDLVKGRVALNPGYLRRAGYITGLGIIDWIGMITFIFGVGLIILAVQWGGTAYAWDSAATIVPFVLGGLLFIAFFLNEYLLGPGRLMSRIFPTHVAMIPSTLFRQKDTSLLMCISFSAGASLVSAFYFVSYYWQLAEGYSSSKAGIQLLYYTPGLGVGVYTAMFMCNVWPRQTFPPLFWGSIVEAVGLGLLTWAVASRQTTLVNVFLAIAGAGTGLRFMPNVLHAAGIWPDRIAAMQSVLSFTLPLGETISISMMGSVFGNKFSQYIRAIIGPGINNSSGSSTSAANLNALDSLPPAILEATRHAAAKAVMWAFVSILPFVAISIVSAAFLGNVWIGQPSKLDKSGRVEREEKKAMVLNGVFLFAVARGNVEEERMEIGARIERADMEKVSEQAPDVEAVVFGTGPERDMASLR